MPTDDISRLDKSRFAAARSRVGGTCAPIFPRLQRLFFRVISAGKMAFDRRASLLLVFRRSATLRVPTEKAVFILASVRIGGL